MKDKIVLNGTEINIKEVLSGYQSEVEAVRKIHEITGASFPEVMDVVKKFKKESAEDDRSNFSEDSNSANDLSEFEKLFDEVIKCPKCGAEIPNKSRFCLECGVDLTKPQAAICPNCGKLIPKNSKFCLNCGHNIASSNTQKENDVITGKCPNCGMIVKESDSICPYCRQPIVFTKKQMQICCPECGSHDIKIDIIQLGTQINGKSIIKEKSPITQAANEMGRKAMTVATGGLWALTPKRSDYKATQSSTVNTINKKVAVCQTCGYSWYL